MTNRLSLTAARQCAGSRGRRQPITQDPRRICGYSKNVPRRLCQLRSRDDSSCARALAERSSTPVPIAAIQLRSSELRCFALGTARNRKRDEAPGDLRHCSPDPQHPGSLHRLPFEDRSRAIRSEEHRRESLQAHHGSQRAQSLGRTRGRGAHDDAIPIATRTAPTA
jgi:hypothetical protein